MIEEVLQINRTLLRAVAVATVPEWCRLELTMAQVKGVMVLGRRGELPVGGLARELAVGLPAASAVVDRLVEHGLVRRQEDPADRRRTLVRLSPQGEELLARLNQGSREIFETWLENLAETQLEQLVSGLRSLAQVAETWAEHAAAGVHSAG